MLFFGEIVVIFSAATVEPLNIALAEIGFVLGRYIKKWSTIARIVEVRGVGETNRLIEYCQL